MSQKELLEHILNLPKEIQNEIYCFNPENRRIHEELLYCVHLENWTQFDRHHVCAIGKHISLFVQENHQLLS